MKMHDAASAIAMLPWVIARNHMLVNTLRVSSAERPVACTTGNSVRWGYPPNRHSQFVMAKTKQVMHLASHLGCNLQRKQLRLLVPANSRTNKTLGVPKDIDQIWIITVSHTIFFFFTHVQACLARLDPPCRTAPQPWCVFFDWDHVWTRSCPDLHK